MGRRLGRLLVVGLGLLSVALTGLIVFRNAVVEAVLKDRLAARAIPVSGLTVADVGLRGAHITGLDLGARGEVSARSLRIAYALGDLIEGRIERVAVEGLALQLDLTGAGPPLGTLQPLLAGPGEGRAAPLPSITLSEGRIDAMTPLGAVIVDFEGEVRSDARGAAQATGGFDLEGEPGRLGAALELSAAPDGTVSGTLTLRDGALALPGADIGGLSGKIAFAWAVGRPPTIDAALSAGRITLPGAVFTEASLRVETTEARMVAAAELRAAEERWSVKARLRLEDYMNSPEARLDLEAEAGAGASLWPLLGLPGPGAGRASARLAAGGRLAPLRRLTGAEGSPLEWLARAALTGRLSLALGAVSYAGRVEALSGEVAIDARLANGVVDLVLSDNARIEAARLSPAWLRGIGLPDALAALLEDGAVVVFPLGQEAPVHARLVRGEAGATIEATGAVRVAAGGGAELEAATRARLGFDEDFNLESLTFDDIELTGKNILLRGARLSELRAHGRLAGAPDRLDGPLDLVVTLPELALGPLRATGSALELRAAVRIGPDGFSARLRDEGRLRIETLGYGAAIALDGPVQVRLTGAEVSLGRERDGGISLDHTLELVADPLRLSVARGGDARLAVAGALGRWRLKGSFAAGAGYRGRTEIDGARLAVPAYALAAEGLSAIVDLGAPGDGPLVDFKVAALRQLGEAPLFAPLRLRGTVRKDGEALQFSAEGQGLEGQGLEGQGLEGFGRVTLEGRHRIAAGRGELRIALGPLTFSRAGAQPAALFPPLAVLRAVVGQAAAEVALTWAPGKTEGEATLTLSDISFDSDEVTVEGLTLELHLDRLLPPGSPAGQRLTVRRLDPGLPLDDVMARFQVRRGDPPRLAIELGELFLSGGRFFVRGALLDPGAERQDLTLQVEGLDLAELFAVLDIEGLSGEGRLSGAIPMALGRDGVVIENGRLDATGPGVLHFRSEQASQILAVGGESTDMLLQALENFHYDELSLTVQKPADDQARLALVLLGNNPDVLDGYPFRFNINLEGDTGNLFSALSEIYGLSNRVLRRAWLLAR